MRANFAATYGRACVTSLSGVRHYISGQQKDDVLFFMGVPMPNNPIPSGHVAHLLPSPQAMEKIAMRDLSLDPPEGETLDKVAYNILIFDFYVNKILFPAAGM